MIGYIDIKDLARAPEILPRLFYFFNFYLFFRVFARTVYITIQSDRVYRYVYTIHIHIGSRNFVIHFVTLRLTDPKKMGIIWTSRFEDLSLYCGLGYVRNFYLGF